MDEASRRITDKLWRGILPTDDSVKTWGGYGTGLTCDGCDAPITSKSRNTSQQGVDG